MIAAGSGKGAAAEAGINNPKPGSANATVRTPVGSTGSSSGMKAAGLLDPNRAFQAINAETLETASAMADYAIPPITTQAGLLIMPLLACLLCCTPTSATMLWYNTSYQTCFWQIPLPRQSRSFLQCLHRQSSQALQIISVQIQQLHFSLVHWYWSTLTHSCCSSLHHGRTMSVHKASVL